MKTVTLKLKEKNQFEYQVKNGAKVLDKIMKVSDGWHAACRVHDTLADAVEYVRNSREQMYCAFGGDCKVVIC